MLLPSLEEIGILRAMSFSYRHFLGIFVCSLLAGSPGCALAQSPPLQQVYRSAPATLQQRLQAAMAHSQPVRQPIQQMSYTSDSTAPQEPKWSQVAVGEPSQTSSELFLPWNLSEFPVRSGEPGTPYRLVSDTQPAASSTPNKTPPPAGAMQRLLAQNTTPKTAPVKPTATVPVHRAMPILGIGKDFLNEFRPSNDRKWSQNHAVLQTAEFDGNRVTVRNVRYSRYQSTEEYTTQYYDATFNLDDIRTLDLVMVPFQGLDRLAHVESSFGFADGRQIGLSIEARYEEGEKYDPAAAGMRQFELVYVLADERDMVRLATDVNKNDVYIYRLAFEPHEVRVMFVDALQRANQLAIKPEFYHPLTNSCVTNLIAHINKGRPNAVPREYRTFMPGLLDSYMYDLKLVATSAKTFKETKEMAKVNWLVERYGDLEYFSAGIRQNMY